MESLPSTIGNLKKLITLVLCINKIQEIPVSIQGCIMLKELIMTRNQLFVLPEELADLYNLEILDVADNNLAVFPDVLPCCRLLCEMNPLLQELPCVSVQLTHPLPLAEITARFLMETCMNFVF